MYGARSADPRFGSITGFDQATMIELSAERGGDPGRPGKKDPLDPVVWLAKRPAEPHWDSRFGPGRPGWHVECAAIASRWLGIAFDVQAGGSDLIFPHHEMSASHARVAHGVADGEVFARRYVHAGMVRYDGVKMSKSLGNLVFVSVLRESGIDPMAIRLAILAHHYREDWDWTDEALAAAVQRLGRWRDAVHRPAGDQEGVLAAIRERMADDLDAPGALAVVDAWADAVLADRPDGASSAAPGLVRDAIDALLGVRL